MYIQGSWRATAPVGEHDVRRSGEGVGHQAGGLFRRGQSSRLCRAKAPSGRHIRPDWDDQRSDYIYIYFDAIN